MCFRKLRILLIKNWQTFKRIKKLNKNLNSKRITIEIRFETFERSKNYRKEKKNYEIILFSGRIWEYTFSPLSKTWNWLKEIRNV